MQQSTTSDSSGARGAVVIGALGVVFGDIGTSPLYTLQTVFNPADPHPVPITTENVYGVVFAANMTKLIHGAWLPTERVAGTAVFLNRGKQTAPLAMRANVEHNHVRYEQVVIMSIETEPVPRDRTVIMGSHIDV